MQQNLDIERWWLYVFIMTYNDEANEMAQRKRILSTLFQIGDQKSKSCTLLAPPMIN